MLRALKEQINYLSGDKKFRHKPVLGFVPSHITPDRFAEIQQPFGLESKIAAVQAALTRPIEEMGKQKGKAKNGKVPSHPPKSRSRAAPSAGPVRSIGVAYSQRNSFPAKKLRSYRLQNSELFKASLPGSVGFAATGFPINPGLSASFPWLSVQAAQWQQYRFHRLAVRYVTKSPSSATGTVIISPEYNPQDPPPTTEQQAENTQDATSDSVYVHNSTKLDVSAMFALGPRKQVRAANVGAALGLYDCATVYLCTSGQANTSAVGDFWFDYDIEFFVPENSPAVAAGAPFIATPTSVLSWTTPTSFTSGNATSQTGVSTASAGISGGSDGLNLALTFSAGAFTPPRGAYLVRFMGSFNDTANEGFTAILSILRNGSVVQFAKALTTGPGSLNPSVQFALGFNGTTDTLSFQITLTGASGTLTITSSQPPVFSLEPI